MNPDLVRLRRGRERVGDARPIRREDEMLRNSVTRQPQAVHPRVAVLVRDHQHVPAAVVAEALEVPIRLVRDLPAAAERVAGDREGVATFVRRAEETGGVGEPDRIHVLGLPVVRRHVDDLPALDLEQEEVRVAAQLTELPGDEPATVRGELARGAPAAELEAPLLPALEPPHDDVEVEPVAAVRRVAEQRPVARDVRRAMDVARIDHERLAVEVELRPLVSALVDLEQKAVVRKELALDRLVVARQLLQLAAVERQPVELARPRQVGGHEQP